MRVAGPLRRLAAAATLAALAPKAWANPDSNAGSDDRWAVTVVLGVLAGLLLVWLGDRRGSRRRYRVRPVRLAVVLVGVIAVVLGVLGFFRGRPVEPPRESTAASSGDPASGKEGRLRLGEARSEVDPRYVGLVAPGLALIALGAWPRKRRTDPGPRTSRQVAR